MPNLLRQSPAFRPLALTFIAAAVFLATLAPLAHAAAPADLPRQPDDPIRWQARVDRYLTIRDKANPPPTGAVVFTGSSSIDMWTTLKADFPDLAVVNRGIGGTWLADQLHIAPQLVYPLEPKIIVLYAGENDLFAERTVADVISAYKAVRDQIRREAPQAHFVFLALKPSPSRDYLTAAMRDANDQIAALCAKDPHCTFVDVFTPMLDATGKPRAELFIEDNLHMNTEGYRLWTSIVAPILGATSRQAGPDPLPPASTFAPAPPPFHSRQIVAPKAPATRAPREAPEAAPQTAPSRE